MMSPKSSLPAGLEPDAAALADLSLPDSGALVRHADGYYWVAPDGRQEFGPFATIEAALADMAEAGGDAPEPGESLREAEDEIGIADWIDPETGDPAEGHTPRFDGE